MNTVDIAAASVGANMYILSHACVIPYYTYTGYIYIYGGTLWRSWLRHFATNRKVVGSIPEGVIAIFH